MSTSYAVFCLKKKIMNVPCMTLRDNTERPETIDLGTNELLGTDPKNIQPAMEKLFQGKWKKGQEIPLFDGKCAERIVLLSFPTRRSSDLPHHCPYRRNQPGARRWKAARYRSA